MSPTELPTDVGLTHIALPVEDLDRSINFYAKYARMRVVHRRDTVAWINDGTRDFVVVLVQVEKVTDPLRPFGHLGTACASRAEMDELIGHAKIDGCLIDGPRQSEPPVGYWCFLEDPDGHTLELSYGQQVDALLDGGEIPGG
jgi:catechol 2,3-dioxygenase-like lactoylglutathione lyase family enzyme